MDGVVGEADRPAGASKLIPSPGACATSVGSVRPDVMLGEAHVARRGGGLRPAAGAHDGCQFVAVGEEVLPGADA